MDVSLSVNESDFLQSLPAGSISTPKVTKGKRKYSNQYSCPKCQRTYVTQFYYNKHVQDCAPVPTSSPAAPQPSSSVTPPPAVTDSLTNNSAIHLDVSALSCAAGPSTQGQAFKVPCVPSKPKPKKVKFTFTCTYCLKGYMSKKYFDSHTRTHRLQDLSKLFPAKDTIVAHVNDISKAALIHVGNAPCGGSNGLKFKELVGVIFSILTTDEWEEVCVSLCCKVIGFTLDDKVMLPSALSTALYEGVENILCDQKCVGDHLNMLNIPSDFPTEVKDQFFLEFMLNFVQEIFVFISKTFRDKYPAPRCLKLPAVLLPEDRQVIYYVAGSIIKGYLHMSFRYKKSQTWSQVGAAIKSRILSDCAIEDQDATWTKSVDRGGLVFVSSECQKFMIALTHIVFSHEERNGSIDYERVIQKVSVSELIYMWDNLIGDSLPPKMSVNLMNDLIRSFCRTCVRGFAKRRLNFLRQKPVISMPTRHLVARRKKT